MSHPAAERILELYREKADGWIADRGVRLFRGEGGPDEAAWLDRFTAGMAPGALVLDVGCGSGWPMGAELLRRGFRVRGVDGAEGLIDHARRTLPEGRWAVADMRELLLSETFDGVLAWHSLFHLSPEDQERTLPRLARLVAPGGRLMFTLGPARGHEIGTWRGQPLYHGSLDPGAYRDLLESEGLTVEAGAPSHGEGRGWAWLARRATISAESAITVP
jgi:SAM-dependent methyltransferase